MTREQVIKGLECCLRGTDWEKMCDECPYEAPEEEKWQIDWDCHLDQLRKDALALLKEQEARVLTLEEVNALKFDDVVYVEVVPTHAVLSAIVIEVIPKVPDIDIGVVQFRYAPTWNGIKNADLTYYGKTWRCWNARPTDEQRKAVKWE